jgi:peptidoglycan/LPS O-acetylase OafA/YrhL
MISPVDRQGQPYRKIVSGHLPSLDGVRGLAILMVLAHNFNLPTSATGLRNHVFGVLSDSGWIGVQLFFVLSGFLITGVLLDARNTDNYYRTFFGRRVLRIFPLYYATLFVAFAVLPVFTVHAPDGRHQVWLWTYLSNWTEPAGYGVPAFPHFWSLAVEEQFYLLWPFVVRHLAPRRLLHVCLGLVVGGLAVRIGLRAAGVSSEAVYMWTICRVDALAAGGALAVALRWPAVAAQLDRRRGPILKTAAVLIMAGFVITRGYPRATLVSQTAGYTILTVVFTALVLSAVMGELRGGPVRRVLSTPLLRAFGKYSYAIYVFHAPLHQLLSPYFMRWAGTARLGLRYEVGYMLLASALTFGVAILSYHLLEKRFLALKGRFVRMPVTAPRTV